MPSRLFLALLLTLLVPSILRAADDAGELAEVKAERDRLKIELAQAKLRLAKVEGDLAALRLTLNDAPRKTGDDADPSAGRSEAPATPDKTKTDRAERHKALGSIPSFLDALPSDLRPNPKEGWTKFSLPKAQAWANKNAPGRTMDVILKVQDVSLTRVQDPTDATQTLGWQVRLSVQAEDVKVFGMDHSVNYNQFGFVITTDEATAKKAEKLEKGHPLRIRGEIESLAISGTDYLKNNPGQIRIRLIHVDLQGIPPKAKP